MTVRTEPPPPAGPVVSRTETGLRRTAVHHVSDQEFAWFLRPGDHSPAALTIRAADRLRALRDASVPECVWLLPEAYGQGLIFRSSSALSAAFWMNADRAIRDRLVPSLVPVRRGLDRLHRVAAPSSPVPPPALVRLLHMLDGRAPRPGAVRLHAMATAAWGPAAMSLLRGWAAETPGGTRLIHGNLSLAALLPVMAADGAGGFEVMTGADLSAGRPEFDVGWLLGEMLELAYAAGPPGATPTLAGDRLAGGLLAGAGLDPVLLGRTMLLRLVTHMHDFAAYMPWTDELAGYTELVRRLLDEDLTRLLPEPADD